MVNGQVRTTPAVQAAMSFPYGTHWISTIQKLHYVSAKQKSEITSEIKKLQDETLINLQNSKAICKKDKLVDFTFELRRLSTDDKPFNDFFCENE